MSALPSRSSGDVRAVFLYNPLIREHPLSRCPKCGRIDHGPYCFHLGTREKIKTEVLR